MRLTLAHRLPSSSHNPVAPYFRPRSLSSRRPFRIAPRAAAQPNTIDLPAVAAPSADSVAGNVVDTVTDMLQVRTRQALWFESF